MSNPVDIDFYGQAVDLVDQAVDHLVAAHYVERGLLTPSLVTPRDRADGELHALHVLLGVGTGRLVVAVVQARGAGLGWAEIGRRLGLPEHDPAGSLADRAYALVLTTAAGGASTTGRELHFWCDACARQVHDLGPQPTRRDSEFGHAGYDDLNRRLVGVPPCPRFDAELVDDDARRTR